MAHQLLGLYFKSIIGSMLSSSSALLFPQHRKRIDAMKDDGWYPGEEYVQMVHDLHAKLGDSTLAAIAQTSVMKTLPQQRAAGFDSIEKVFGNFDVLVNSISRESPAYEATRMLSLTADTLVLENQTRLPPSLQVGFYRGILMAFGKIVTSDKVERNGDTVRYTLKFV